MVIDVLKLSRSHWYLAIICNLQHLERRLDKDSAANDSDTTMGDDAAPIDKNASGDGASAVDLDTHPEKMDTSSDKEPDVAETRHNLESMTVEEGGTQKEWPSEDEVERLDEKQEHKNQQYFNNKLVDNPASSTNTVEGDSHEKSDEKSRKQSKERRKSNHYNPPNTYV
jgi:hypothetical protein